jgi:hypothetical protein
MMNDILNIPLPWWEGLGEGVELIYLHPHLDPPHQGGGDDFYANKEVPPFRARRSFE